VISVQVPVAASLQFNYAEVAIAANILRPGGAEENRTIRLPTRRGLDDLYTSEVSALLRTPEH
jgi:hypothetical protein